MITNWCIYPLTVADQQQHIDFSEKLLSLVQPGDLPILYWSMAEPAGLVLGFSQRPTILNQRSLASTPLPIYHRRAGGTAVLVGSTLLSLDVILPADHPLVLADIVESYRWFGETWVAALSQLGIQSRIVPTAEAHAQRELRKNSVTRVDELLLNRACYGSLSPYEVVHGRRKIVGFDMIRRKTGSLLQAGILLEWDFTRLAYLLGHTEEEQARLHTELPERAVGLNTLLQRYVQSKEVIAAFESALAAREHTDLTLNSTQAYTKQTLEL